MPDAYAYPWSEIRELREKNVALRKQISKLEGIIREAETIADRIDGKVDALLAECQRLLVREKIRDAEGVFDDLEPDLVIEIDALRKLYEILDR